MKLFQKSLLHTGYFILKNKKVYPAFTEDLIAEGRMTTFSKGISRIYGVADLKDTLKYCYKFKKEYGIFPREGVEVIRTGFKPTAELNASISRFIYK